MKKKKWISSVLVFLILFSITITVHETAYAAETYSGIGISSGQSSPMGIVGGPDGALYISEYGGGKIVKIDRDGQNKTTFATGLNQPIGLAFDDSGNLYTAEHTGRKVTKMDSDGNTTLVKNFSGFLAGIAIDSHGKIFVASYTEGKIYKMDSDGSNDSVFATGFNISSLIGMTIDASDNIYVADRSGSKVIKVEPDGTASDFITGIPSPNWVTLGADGFFYVSAGNRTIVKADVSGTIVQTFSTGTLSAWGSSVDAGGYIYFAELTGSVQKLVGSASAIDTTHISLLMNTSMYNVQADTAAFTISGIASAPIVTAAVVSGQAIELTLSSAMPPSYTNIRLAYTQTGTNDLVSKAGSAKLDDFSGLKVMNNLILDQAAPTGLAGVAPTSALNDGKITGTTIAMEYKLASADDSAYTACSADETTVAVAGDYLVRLAAKPGYKAGETSAVTVPAYAAPSSGRRNSSPSVISSGAEVIVNGQTQTAGTVATSTLNGQTVTTVTVDTAKLQNLLDAEGNHAVVTIPITGSSDVAAAGLTGQMVKNMEEKEATLEVKTGAATYTFPASEIDIDSISKKLGQNVTLSDIEVEIKIAEPSKDIVKVVENAAETGQFDIVVPAVEFTINCTYNGKTVAVSSFNSYVERTVAIPDGVDPTKITTGVVVSPDGTVRQGPTQIIQIDGKYYAKIKSLTNSTYALIWNQVTFADAANHWAKDSINNMGARMIVTGVGNGSYNPNNYITRAEFAAIIVRALGLEAEAGQNSFRDVNEANWFSGYVETASKYGIINGYEGARFLPNDKITREQAMTMIARTMKLTRLEPNLTDSEMSALLSDYKDADTAAKYSKQSIASCLETGVVAGAGSNTLAPKNNITRAEVAVIVERLLEKSKLI
jgi:sugar lactone lactonase YvrE